MELEEILENKTIIEGLENKIFSINKDTKYIHYNIKNKQKYIITKPEEFVRAKTLVEIVQDYKYQLEYIDFEVPTQIGAKPDIPADIIIFKDIEHKTPYIVYELKKEDITPKMFEQAVNQGFSYAVTQNAKYVAVTNGTKESFYEVFADKPRERIENIISHIPINFDEATIKEPKYKKVENDPQPKTESELIQKFKTCHDTLWAGGKRAPTEAFDELDKLIFCKFFDEKEDKEVGEPYKFQIYGTVKQIEKRIKDLYEDGRKIDPQVFREGIKLNNYELIEIVKTLQDINLIETDLDAKGKAFETFMDGFFRGAFGQFFTPREVVKMIVNVLPIKNSSKVLDTSCGSGGFLLYALDKVRKQADKALEEKRIKIEKWHPYWHDFASKNLFGIEINEQISRTAKMNMIIHDDGHTNVITYDGLKPIDELKEIKKSDKYGNEFVEEKLVNLILEDTNNQFFVKNSFDFILTNPPFGGSIKETELDGFENYELTKKKPHFFDKRLKNTKDKVKASEKSEVLFIERAYEYLEVDGVLAIVLPDGVLTNSTLEYAREFMEEHFQYLAIISLPSHTFSVSDAGVKSSVLFLKKYSKEKTEQIQSLKEQLQDKAFSAYETDIYDAKKRKDKEAIAKYKERVEDEYKKNLKLKIKELYDCEVFMGNVQMIGYDTVGNKIEDNDLIDVEEQIKLFMNGMEIDFKDKNKIFKISFSELIGKRIDPYFYLPKFKILDNKLNNSKWKIKKLGEICEIYRGGSPRPIKKYMTNKKDGINWIKIGDTKNINKYIYKTKEKIIADGVKYSRFVREGDFILSNSMSFGKPYIMKTTGCIHDGWLLLRKKDNEVSEDYLYTVLSSDLIYQFFKQATIGGVVENLNISLVKEIRIPIPPIQEQKKIINIIDHGIKLKEEKEKEAKEVLKNAKKQVENMILGDTNG